jgi:hypothetical protein
MIFEIRKARNGYILKASGREGTTEEVVCQEKYDDEVECFADFLRYLNEEYGPSTLAVKGIFESILWGPAVRIVPTKVEICSP